MHHQISSTRILHNKTYMLLRGGKLFVKQCIYRLSNYFFPLCRNLKDPLTEVWKQANRLTRKGCLIELATSNILFSDIRLSTSSLAMMSPFFRALIANTSPVFLYSDSNTYNVLLKKILSDVTSLLLFIINDCRLQT